VQRIARQPVVGVSFDSARDAVADRVVDALAGLGRRWLVKAWPRPARRLARDAHGHRGGSGRHAAVLLAAATHDAGASASAIVRSAWASDSNRRNA